jgi:predicted DNA-binding transcriptional regulator AlpA
MPVEISEKEQQRRAEQHRQSLELNRQKLAYTIPELVSASGAGRSKIYQEIAAGRLKVRKLGKRTLALHDDATAWLQSLPAA